MTKNKCKPERAINITVSVFFVTSVTKIQNNIDFLYFLRNQKFLTVSEERCSFFCRKTTFFLCLFHSKRRTQSDFTQLNVHFPVHIQNAWCYKLSVVHFSLKMNSNTVILKQKLKYFEMQTLSAWSRVIFMKRVQPVLLFVAFWFSSICYFRTRSFLTVCTHEIVHLLKVTTKFCRLFWKKAKTRNENVWLP